MITMSVEADQYQQSAGKDRDVSLVTFRIVDFSGNVLPFDRIPPGITEYNDQLHGKNRFFWEWELLREGVEGMTQSGYNLLATLQSMGFDVENPLVPQPITSHDQQDIYHGDPISKIGRAARYNLGASAVGAEREATAIAEKKMLREQGLRDVVADVRTDFNYVTHQVRVAIFYHGNSFDCLTYRLDDEGHRETDFVEGKDMHPILRYITDFFNSDSRISGK